MFIASVSVADQLGIFDRLSERASWSTADLASVTGAESGLVLRLLRILCGLGFAAQLDADEFGSTGVSRQMTKASVKAGVKVYHEETLLSARYAPEFFKQNEYRLPKTQTDGPYNFAENTTDDPFTHMSKKPGVMENFNVFMQGLFGLPMRLNWSDWYPVKEKLLDGFDSSKGEYCFVDVGGGKGHECERILHKHPDMKGKLVTQDLQFVINDIQHLDPRIEKMCHDFRKPQPIQGARVYFLQ